MSDSARLAVHGLSKRFGATLALSDVSFDVAPGERLAIVGENGAGKSTLIKILIGAHKADRGTIELDGEPFAPASPAEAMAAGVSVVYQEPSFFRHLSVLENMFAGREIVTRLGNMAWGQMRKEAEKAFQDFELSPGLLNREMGSLSLAEQQMVLICRAVQIHCKVLILDEPTSILTAAETVRLFKVINRLSAGGVTVLYITHRFEELFEIADRMLVLKDGELVGDLPAGEADHDTIIHLMTGHAVVDVRARDSHEVGPTLLEVRGLTQAGAFEDIDLDVGTGEIVGLYGLVGAGRTELALTVFGDTRPDAGTMKLRGQQYSPRSPRDAMKQGVAYLPEDRKTQGIFPDMTVGANIVAPLLKRAARTLGVMNLSWLLSEADDGIATLRIKTPSADFPVTGLSGGHQQKTLYARWLATNPTLLLLDEPTRGIDVGTKAEIHARIIELADQGIGMLVISSELPELLAIADRIVVMRAGCVRANLTGSDITEDAVLRAALGVAAAKEDAWALQ